jgi:recombination protein RecA
MKEKVKKKIESNRERSQIKRYNWRLTNLTNPHGKGTVMKMGDKAIVEVETISSGSLGIDLL